MGFLGSILSIGAAFATGGAALYWQAAAFLYSFAKGGTAQKGARLSDLTIALDGEGQELGKGWGRWRQEMRLVWTSGLIEKKKTKKKGGLFGIGGTKVTTYTYATRCLLIGGQGPITRLNRLKLNQYAEYDWNGGGEQGAEMVWNGQFWQGKTAKGIKIRVYPGTLSQPIDALLTEAKGEGQWTNYPGKWLIALEIPNLEKYGNQMPRVSVEMEYAVTALDAVILEVGSWVGLEAHDFDLSALEGLSVAPNPDDGFSLDSRRKACDVFGELMDIYHFCLPEVDGVLRAVLRPMGSVATLPEAALRVRAGYEAGEVADAPLKEADEENLSKVREFLFRDPKREYAPGYRFSRRFDAATERKTSSQTSASMSGARASGVVRVLQAEEWAAATGRDGTLGLAYLWLAAGDEALITTPDGLASMLLDQTDVPLFGPIGAKWQGFDPLVYNLPLRDETTGIERPTPLEPGLLVVFAGEIPIVSTQYLSQKAYVVGACRFTRNAGYRGAIINVDRRVPGGAWQEVDEDEVEDESIIGELTGDWTPPSGIAPSDEGFNCHVWGGALQSAVLDDGSANWALFSNGLLCSLGALHETAGNADSRFYEVETLRAGIYGTDDFKEPLTAGTRFILLSDADGLMLDGPLLGGTPPMPVAGTELRLRINEEDSDEQVTWDLGVFVGENTRTPAPTLTATRDTDGALSLVGAGRTRFYEDALLSGLPATATYREKEFSQGFKYQVTLNSNGQSASVVRYTPDDQAEFILAFPALELASLLGQSESAIALSEISGTIALWGEVALGRPRAFGAAVGEVAHGRIKTAAGQFIKTAANRFLLRSS